MSEQFLISETMTNYNKFIEKNIRTVWVKKWAIEFLKNLELQKTELEIEKYCVDKLQEFSEICQTNADKRTNTERRKNDNPTSWAQSSVSYLSGIRKAVKDWGDTITLDESNSYLQKTKEGVKTQHLALLYMNYPESHNKENVINKQNRKTEQRQNLEDINCVDKYQNTIERMLSSNDHRTLAAGLVAASGRRPSEIYKTAEFKQITQFEVLFKGQLKTHGEEREPYPTYTLVESAKVIDGLARLRRMPQVKKLSRKTLAMVDSGKNTSLNLKVKEYFSPLINPPHGESVLSAKNLRASYVAIAIYLFCPLKTSPNLFITQRLGHTSDGTATAYEDYRVTDSQGNPLMYGVWVNRLTEAMENPMDANISQARIRMSESAKNILEDQTFLPFADQVSRIDELIRLARIGKQFEEGKLVNRVTVEIPKIETTPEVSKTESNPVISKIKSLTGEDKIKRAIQAIKTFNEHQSNVKDMWMINTSTLKELTNCRTSIVEKYLKSEEGKVQVGKYNLDNQMTYQHNRGRGIISKFIVLN